MFPPPPPVAPPFVARPRRAGFSLVEVVLAVGVISFAFVAILGLLPAGLQQFRQAMDNSVASQIAQRIIMDAQQTDFDTLTKGLSVADPYGQIPTYVGSQRMYVRYFDEQGNEVVPASSVPSPAEAAKIVYFVNTRVTIATPVPGMTAADIGTNPTMATVLVEVAFNPSGKAIQANGNTAFQFDPSAIQTRHIPVKRYTAQIGRNF